jgi:Na+-driven multidrug efflux pump
VAALAAFVLWWVAALQPVNAVVFVLDGLLIGAGDLRFLAQAMAGAAAVFVVAAGAVLATGAGIGWLWAAIGAFMVARLVPLAARWAGGRWAVVGAAR